MDEFDGAGFFGHGFNEVDEADLVGVGGKAVQDMDAGVDGNGLSVKPDPAIFTSGLADDGSSWCSLGLITDKQHIIFGIIQVSLQVGHDAAAGQHAAACDDDGRPGKIQKFLVVMMIFHGVEVFKFQRVIAAPEKIPGFLVPTVFEGCINVGDFETQRGVDKHGNVRIEGVIGLEPVDFVDQFLGPAQGKGRNEHLATVCKGLVQDSAEFFGASGPIRMNAIAVGGFQNQKIAGVRRLRIRQQRCVDISKIA